MTYSSLARSHLLGVVFVFPSPPTIQLIDIKRKRTVDADQRELAVDTPIACKLVEERNCSGYGVIAIIVVTAHLLKVARSTLEK